MTLDAGVMSVTIEFAKDLKDSDWFGKQDPYCVVKVGSQTFRTQTAVDGGRNPVWHQTFQFSIINENDAVIEVRDEGVGRDDLIGTASFSMARARAIGSDRIQVPVFDKKKQQGFVCVNLNWAPNKDLCCKTTAPTSYPQQVQPYPQPYPQQSYPYPQQYPQQYAMPGYPGGQRMPAPMGNMQAPSQQAGQPAMYYYQPPQYQGQAPR